MVYLRYARDEDSWEEGYAAGKKESMTKGTRRWEQMEYDLSQALNANSILRGTVMDQARKVRNLQTELNVAHETIARMEAVAIPEANNPAWQRGYRHGLAQCNHHPQAPEQ